jgi:hypothetical protein
MKTRNALTAIVLASAISLGGCGKAPESYIEGEVIERVGDVIGLTKSEVNGLFVYGETVKLGNPTYVMKVKTNQGIYTIQVDALDTCGSHGPQTIYSIAVATKTGTKIRFPTKCYGTNENNQPAGFSSSKVGMLDPDDIEILQ